MKPATLKTISMAELEKLRHRASQVKEVEFQIGFENAGWWVWSEDAETTTHDRDGMSFSEAIEHLKKLAAPPETVTITLPYQTARALAMSPELSNPRNKMVLAAKACKDAISKFED